MTQDGTLFTSKSIYLSIFAHVSKYHFKMFRVLSISIMLSIRSALANFVFEHEYYENPEIANEFTGCIILLLNLLNFFYNILRS